jgi:hypothetical protein
MRKMKSTRALVLCFISFTLGILVFQVYYIYGNIASLPKNLENIDEKDNTCFLEIRYVIFDKDDNGVYLEVIDTFWINGAPDFNNRPYKFRKGETVSITCPENILGVKFAFWQKQEWEPTFQGLIVTNRTIVLQLNEAKIIWWANYVGDLSSLMLGS